MSNVAIVSREKWIKKCPHKTTVIVNSYVKINSKNIFFFDTFWLKVVFVSLLALQVLTLMSLFWRSVISQYKRKMLPIITAIIHFYVKSSSKNKIFYVSFWLEVVFISWRSSSLDLYILFFWNLLFRNKHPICLNYYGDSQFLCKKPF